MSGPGNLWSGRVQHPFDSANYDDLTADGIRRDTQPVRLTLLGEFSISSGATRIDSSFWQRRKASQIIKLLAIQPGRRLHREQVLEYLWPDLNGPAAANNYRVTLHSVRQVLASHPGMPQLFRVNGELLELVGNEQVSVDVQDFEASAEAALATRNALLYQQAISLYTGDFLPEDRYEEWSLAIRERLRETYLELVVGLGTLRGEQGEFDEARKLLREAISIDPPHEETHVALMRVHAKAGNRRAAIRQFDELCGVLRRHLNAEPDPDTRRLHEEILNHRFPDEEDSLPTITLLPATRRTGPTVQEAPRHNLPSSLTPFVGRKEEIPELQRVLKRSRLVTVTGPGGNGKTRLSLNVAEKLVDEYPDGVWLVELASVAVPDLVIRSVSAVLGVRDEPWHSLLDRLIRHLQGQRLLLLLDNCEHLVYPVATLVDQLLRSCSGIQVMATSREALQIPGEIVWPLPPMSLPKETSTLSPEQLRRSDAVELFAQRAREVSPDFSLSDDDTRAVADICRRLDGMPLAIELAAAWIAVLPVAQIAHRLDSVLGFLTTGPRTAPWRHQTLRATLDWSYRLLSTSERVLLRRLSVFVGGFTIEAAEAVCSCDDVPPDCILDLLRQLIEKSLVTVERRDADVRYRMLETIREYAQDRLEQAGEAQPVREQCRAWYLTLGEEAERGLVGTEIQEWMQRLLPEIDNVRAVLYRGVNTSDHETVLRLAATLWQFWLLSGRMSEGRGWLEASLADSAVEGVSELTRARAFFAAGFLAERQGDYRQAIQWSEECLTRSRAIGDQWGVNYALNNLCLCTLSQGDVERTISLARENLELSRTTGIRPVVPTSLSSLGLAEYWRGNLDAALQYLQDAVAAAREIGFTAFASWLLGQLADVSRAQGDVVSARNYAEESIVLGQVADDEYGPALGRRVLGRLAASAGDYAEAAGLIGESLESFQTMGYKLRMIECVEDLAELAAAHSDAAQATRLLTTADRWRELEGCRLPPYRRQQLDRTIEQTRVALPASDFDASVAEGRAMTLEQTVEDALALFPG